MVEISPSTLLWGVVVIFVTHWLMQRWSIYKFAYELPHTLWGLPIFGCILSIGRINDLLNFLQSQWKNRKERTFCTFLATMPLIFTSDPNVVKQILTHTAFIEKAKTIYDPIRDAADGGMVGSRAKKALLHRKMLQPAFRLKQLLNFMSTFNVKGLEFVEELNQICVEKGEVHNLWDKLRLHTINISRVTTMGSMEMSSDYKDEVSNLQQHFKFVIRHLFWEVILNCANMKWLIHYNPFFNSSIKKLCDVTQKTISYRITAVHLQNVKENVEKNLVIDLAYKHFLNGYIRYNEFLGEINELLMASYVTSASTLYSTMVLLAMHPDIQERVYEEIVSIFPIKGVNVEYEHLGQLIYLEMVINETLRLFPPIPMIGREVTQETPLEVDNKWFKLPKDMQIIIDIMGLHRNPNYWGPNAEKFDPDNFLPQNIANRSPYAFVPFSKGSRICFGWTYAYMVLKVILVHIFRNYRLSTGFKYENLEVEANIFLEYKNEPLLCIHRRS